MTRRVLIADDHDVSRRLLSVTLTAAGFTVESASDGAEAWAALQRPDAPELVILDWGMPGLSGPDICQRIRAETQAIYTYLVILSARSSREDVTLGLQSGADDFVSKPFHGPELVERVKAGARVLDLQQRLRAAQADLLVQATRDALTGLWNRRAIMELFDSELARVRRSGGWLTVALADVDNFKRINDTHGHAVGDAILREVAAAVKGCLRPYDEVGRYGGEEFLVLLGGCPAEAGPVVGDRLRVRVAEHSPVGKHAIRASVSIGVASTRGDIEGQRLIHAADLALYRAKHSGKNRVVAATEADLAGDGEPSKRHP